MSTAGPPHAPVRDERRSTTVGIAHLAVGVPLLTIGLLVHHTVYVPNQAAIFTLVPVVSSDRVGGVFTLHF